MKKIILGIESSCDETSASIIEGRGNSSVKILSNIISSQVDIHRKYGGVVPEVASRAHVKFINIVMNKAFRRANKKIEDLSAIAVTCGPGLAGSLVVGLSAAKIMSKILKKPLICVNHLEGHIYANFIEQNYEIKFPAIVLVASGGHTQILKMDGHHNYKILGNTKDDACGEAFDKVARVLGLDYPGGPQIEKFAQKGNDKKYTFPRFGLAGETIRNKEGFLEKVGPSLDFSFSGLKTAVLLEVKKNKRIDKADVAASFQEAVIDVLVKKTIWAAERVGAKSIMISGGVSANKKLVRVLRDNSEKNKIDFYSPRTDLSTDNAAMIAIVGYFRFIKKKKLGKVSINPNLKL